MLQWLRRRGEAHRLAQADAEALVRDHGAEHKRTSRNFMCYWQHRCVKSSRFPFASMIGSYIVSRPVYNELDREQCRLQNRNVRK